MFGSEPLSHVTFYNINIGIIDDAVVILGHTKDKVFSVYQSFSSQKTAEEISAFSNTFDKCFRFKGTTV